MKIQVGGLSQGTYTYQFHSTPEELGLDDRFPSEVIIDATLEKAATQIFLDVAVTTDGRVECDRCVTQLRLPLKNTYRMYYVWDGAEAGVLDPLEVRVFSPGLPMINISDDVRQTVLLSVPLKLLCKANCRGLCPECGTNMNVDSCTCSGQSSDGRWEALRTLRNSLS
ncbi:MAG: DUF177 domain-containing protein [Bacteroidetes bacterium]|nr:DUF177 domain-containing protein [Bacteroidota bacterium]